MHRGAARRRYQVRHRVQGLTRRPKEISNEMTTRKQQLLETIRDALNSKLKSDGKRRRNRHQKQAANRF
jgi:hypothetical protein